MLRSLYSCGWLLVLVTCLGLPAEAGPVPGTPVSLDSPQGFEPAPNFPGFINPETQSSIMVTQIPGPIAAVIQGFTADRLATRQITLLSEETVQVDGRSAMLLKLSQVAGGGVEVYKWALIRGDETATTLVLATWLKPEQPLSDREVEQSLRRTLLSASWSNRAIDPFEGLPFRVTPTDRLKVASAMGGALLLTSDGTINPDQPGKPMLVIAPSIQTVIMGDLRAFSEKRAAQIAQVTQLHNVTGKHLTIDGLQAYELVAEALDKDNANQRLQIYQLVMQTPGQDGYFIAQGFVRQEQAAEFLPILRQVAQSFKRIVAPSNQGRN